jgi:hypothetical protein
MADYTANQLATHWDKLAKSVQVRLDRVTIREMLQMDIELTAHHDGECLFSLSRFFCLVCLEYSRLESHFSLNCLVLLRCPSLRARIRCFVHTLAGGRRFLEDQGPDATPPSESTRPKRHHPSGRTSLALLRHQNSVPPRKDLRVAVVFRLNGVAIQRTQSPWLWFLGRSRHHSKTHHLPAVRGGVCRDPKGQNQVGVV